MKNNNGNKPHKYLNNGNYDQFLQAISTKQLFLSSLQVEIIKEKFKAMAHYTTLKRIAWQNTKEWFILKSDPSDQFWTDWNENKIEMKKTFSLKKEHGFWDLYIWIKKADIEKAAAV